MTEDKKYYTPQIEEFHVGFECEIYSLDEEIPKWIPFVILDLEDLVECHNGLKLEGNIQAKYCRVKVLDEEDIKSFGFNYIEEYNPILETSYGKKYSLKFSENGPPISLWYANEGNKCHIWQQDIVYFNGTIKNKSVLKQVLRMVGVAK